MNEWFFSSFYRRRRKRLVNKALSSKWWFVFCFILNLEEWIISCLWWKSRGKIISFHFGSSSVQKYEAFPYLISAYYLKSAEIVFCHTFAWRFKELSKEIRIIINVLGCFLGKKIRWICWTKCYPNWSQFCFGCRTLWKCFISCRTVWLRTSYQKNRSPQVKMLCSLLMKNY